MLLVLILLLGNGIGHRPPQRVDVIEFNSVYDECTGQLKYSQYIFREWNPHYRRDDIVGWVMPGSARVMHTMKGERHIVKWEVGKLRYEIEAPIYKETNSLHDPERLESKHYLHEGKRTGLRPVFTRVGD